MGPRFRGDDELLDLDACFTSTFLQADVTEPSISA